MKVKIKWIIAFAIGIVVLGGYDYYKISRLNSFANGVVTDFYERASKYVTRYEFEVNTKKFNGVYSGLWNSKNSKNQYFLIAYDKNDPNYNVILFKRGSIEKQNIDSLNSCCKPTDFINFWYY